MALMWAGKVRADGCSPIFLAVYGSQCWLRMLVMVFMTVGAVRLITGSA